MLNVFLSLFCMFTIIVEDVEEKENLDEMDSMSHVMKYVILAMICLMAFSIRLFAVVRWESVSLSGYVYQNSLFIFTSLYLQVIHEYDPHFNYRTTKFLVTEGPYSFLNWFDDRSWYPLGRIVGGTIYPGLMVTAAWMHWILNWLNISVNPRNMCVFTAPIFSANCALATYLFVKEASRRSSTSLLAAALVAIVPAYISRSVGGSYDNEGVAIFALIFTFYLWIKAVNTGSMMWALMCALAYFYMVAAWGGYVFIINIIPIYVVVMTVAGRWSYRLYIAYCTFYIVGSLLAMQVPFVGFNVFWQAECAASHGVFIFCNAFMLLNFIRSKLTGEAFETLLRTVFAVGVGAVAIFILALQLSGKMEWTGRSLTLLDPTYASKYIPIIASVSEHQPTSWTSFFFDLHIATPFAPGIFVKSFTPFGNLYFINNFLNF
jgi:dolichyl-diphosphooligosaccharide--protein glycosyltransferase